MQKFIIIDQKIKEEHHRYLASLGYEILKVPQNKFLYDEISSHTDISFCKIRNDIFVEPSLFELFSSYSNNINFICGENTLDKKYPKDVRYNVCNIGNFVIHNFNYTDIKILDYIDKNKLEKIEISQGYANCAICVIDEKSCITADSKISEILKKHGIDVLLISKNNEENIKLLKNDGSISSMHGFIGGCMGKIEDKIILFGDLDYLEDGEKIKDFIRSKGYELVDFKGHHIIDYGGMIATKE